MGNDALVPTPDAPAEYTDEKDKWIKEDEQTIPEPIDILARCRDKIDIRTRLETRASAMAKAIAKPSLVLVPRPNSSIKTLYVISTVDIRMESNHPQATPVNIT